MEMLRIQCQELVNIFLAVLLLLVSSLGSSSAQMCETESCSVSTSSASSPIDSLAMADSGTEEAFSVAVQNWQGFAAKDDESHPIRLNVETIKTVDPAEARRLLALNISLEEVRFQARAGGRDAILRGRIRFNNDSYRLIDIRLVSSGNRSKLQANIAGPSSISGLGDAESIVGNTALTISVVGGMNVAEGYVVIDDSKYSGNYSLTLNECSGKGPRAGKWVGNNE